MPANLSCVFYSGYRLALVEDDIQPKGVVRQMQLFFKDPLDSSGLGMDGGGFLRCAHVPHDELAASLDNLMP